jgi:hypothetical protein
MTPDEWASEVARILGYWYDSTCEFIEEYDDDESVNFVFIMFNDHWYCKPIEIPEPMNACAEFSKYFEITLKNIGKRT